MKEKQQGRMKVRRKEEEAWREKEDGTVKKKEVWNSLKRIAIKNAR